jgi:hypothetical protein
VDGFKVRFIGETVISAAEGLPFQSDVLLVWIPSFIVATSQLHARLKEFSKKNSKR